MLGVLVAIALAGALVAVVVMWWTMKAAISMIKRVVALAFVLGLTAVLLAAAAVAFFAAHH
jgi:hypothetical protein